MKRFKKVIGKNNPNSVTASMLSDLIITLQSLYQEAGDMTVALQTGKFRTDADLVVVEIDSSWNDPNFPCCLISNDANDDDDFSDLLKNSKLDNALTNNQKIVIEKFDNDYLKLIEFDLNELKSGKANKFTRKRAIKLLEEIIQKHKS